MCTVTWLRDVDGYEVFFNRDEKRSRQPATPPRVGIAGDIPFLAPRDGDEGGSWLAVNACGLTVGLLNYYPRQPAGEPEAGRVSRGRLVLELMRCTGLPALSAALARRDLRPYRPFLLAAFGVRGEAVFAWDGRRLVRRRGARAAMPLSSSSYETRTVVEGRTAQFHRRFPAGAAPDADALAAYHRSHEPERGAYSVCMHRPDACTVSFSRLRVSGGVARFVYHAGPPCEPADTTIVERPLEAASA